jgi:hypothetical protein
MMNNPVANTAASEARNSTGVSFGLFSTTFSALLFFFATVGSCQFKESVSKTRDELCPLYGISLMIIQLAPK